MLTADQRADPDGLFGQIFPGEDFRFHLTLKPGDLRRFFAPTAEQDPILAERQNWLRQDPARYAACTEQGESLVTQFFSLANSWLPIQIPSQHAAIADLVELGGRLEPDFLLLARDHAGAFRLRAGLVCFPSSWNLAEKIGATLDEIHGPVPGLNSELGPSIGRFLARLKADTSFERVNWGLAATPELNLHPSLFRPRLAQPFDLSRTWLRVEEQIVHCLPESCAILFGIKVKVIPLAEVLKNPLARAGLHQAVATMPTAVAAYKGIGAVRGDLLAASALT